LTETPGKIIPFKVCAEVTEGEKSQFHKKFEKVLKLKGEQVFKYVISTSYCPDAKDIEF